MELTVQNVYGLLLRSKLLPVDDARAMFARWQDEAKEGAHNTARFAAWMVANRYVTEYQAALLARGHAEGFYLDEYKILDRRGKGRMAGVYKAQHPLGQTVAIKVLPPSKAKESLLLGRFQREAKLAMRLKHPNIVRTYQVGSAGEIHYLVMEYLEGETLEETLSRRSKLPPAEAVRIIHQALLGLQHIHQQGLVHRDLKPANLMLVPGPGASVDSTWKTTVKILDIGLGRALFEDPPPESMAQLGEGHITGEGVILGTPDYMSPEQARDARAADIRSDIYSLGCVLYHLLAGHPPFPDTNIISQMIRHASETARPLADFNPAVPDGLQQIVNWMIAKDPGQRYPTPERAAQALQVFLVAGAEPSELPDDERMSKYLLWLEGQQGREAVPAVAQARRSERETPPELPASGVRKTAAVPAASAKPSRSVRRARRHGQQASPPPPSPGPGGDVELVSNSANRALPSALVSLEFSRRDYCLFAAGAFVGGLATLVACVAVFSRRPARREEAPEQPADNHQKPETE